MWLPRVGRSHQQGLNATILYVLIDTLVAACFDIHNSSELLKHHRLVRNIIYFLMVLYLLEMNNVLAVNGKHAEVLVTMFLAFVYQVSIVMPCTGGLFWG